MQLIRTLSGAAAALAATGASLAQSHVADRVDSFRPLSSFNVPGINAEIVDVANQGNLLVYTDASARQLGFVDITDPTQPALLTTLTVPGEPTSVTVSGRYAFAAVWADLPVTGSPAPAFGPGKLVVIDLQVPSAPVALGTVDIGFHPDSCKVKRVGNTYYVVVAIENQPVVVVNGLVTSEDRPGSPNDASPAGLIQVVRVQPNQLANATVIDVPLPAATLSAAGLLYPNDPQPEFVAWHGDRVAVTLQENNGVALLDLSNPNQPVLTGVFSTGVCADRPGDVLDNATIDLSQAYPSAAPLVNDAGGIPVVRGSRMPDGITFSPDGARLFTADEGEFNYTGGRGFSTWNASSGAFVTDDGGSLEQAAVVFSHYPESRSDARGIEVEGVATGRFGDRDFLFVLSERGSFLAVHRLTASGQTQLQQILPTGLSPEGIVVIPQRRLVVTADELSGTLTVFQGQRGPWLPSLLQPQLVADDLATPWAAISGLCAGVFPGQFFAVPDNAMPTAVYRIQTGLPWAPVKVALPVLRNGVQARYDGEGIARDTSIVAPATPGFWIASEGNGTSRPNLLVQVDGAGNVLREIQMPNNIDAGADATIGGTAVGSATGGRVGSNGFEGVALTTDGRFLFAAIQREFAGEFPTGTKYARIARYDLQQVQGGTAPQNGLRVGGDWQFFYFAFETNDPINWPGLSEITALGNARFLVIERDKGVGAGSTLKRIYGFNLNGLTPDTDGVPDASDTVTKVLVRDVVEQFSPYEKIEGIGVSWGTLWVGLDNDGGQLESRMRWLGWLGHLAF
jgi:Esterase-like activity of phytase/LVIVD repeat